MEDLLPIAFGIVSMVVTTILGIITWLQREKSKADAALIAELRRNHTDERADRKAAELRLDAFRDQIGAVTSVLERAITFAERVAGTAPGTHRRVGDRRG